MEAPKADCIPKLTSLFSTEWSSLCGHEPCEGCVEIGMRCLGPSVELPMGYGATNRVRGVPTWACGGRGGRM
eukprot:2313749-Pyramimonas_sp.AAC.1